MDMYEVDGDEIDVENIMHQIRNNIKERKGGAHNAYVEDVSNKSLQASNASTGQDDLKQNLDYINSNWDLYADYYISSHRPIIGRFLVLGRQFIHGEVKRYVDLLVRKQKEFNMHVVGTLNNHIETVMNINENIDDKINVTVNDKMNEIVATINKDIKNKAWLSDLLDDKIKTNITTQLPPEKTDDVMNYFLFEEKFRGSTEDIKNRQSIYREYFKNCRNVLDIGCGRGEFLSLMKENGIGAKGIDMNEDMVMYCQKNGLEVNQDNALSYLTSLSDKTLDGIFLAQVVEHLQPTELITMVKLSYDKLQYGSYFIAETINPLCVMASQWFYLDLSHVRLIHPDTMKFVMESVGFRDIEFKFFSPVPDESKLKKIDTSRGDEKDMSRYELMNQNIEKLNQLLYGNQDYAVIGKK